MQLKLGVLLLSGFGLAGLQAQQAVPAAGGNAAGSGGTVAYTVGQTSYMTQTDGNTTITQGVQQPYEISLVTGIEYTGSITLECSVYPNPTSDYVILKVGNEELSTLSVQLFDLNGRLLLSKKVENNETTIPMQGLLPSTYFLKVNDNQKEIRTYKIIKY